MHANFPASNEPVLSGVSVAELRCRALTERCALTVETIMHDIVCSDVDEVERSQAILDIAVTRSDLPHIQARSCRDLSIMDPSRARELVRYLLKEPPSDERDVVRARAFATLAELPNLTEQEALVVAQGLKDRFPIVREHVARAVKLLALERFQELQAVVERLAGNKGTHVIALRALVDQVASGIGNASALDAQLTAKRDASGERDLQRSSPAKPLRERGVASRPVRTPVVKRAPGATMCGKSSSRGSSQRADTSTKEYDTGPVVAAAPPPVPESLAALSAPPRSGESSPLASLQALRSDEFSSLTWAELRCKTESSQNARTLCACIAEMAIRFGKDATLQVAAGQLCFVASYPDPEIKAMSFALSTYLFSS